MKQFLLTFLASAMVLSTAFAETIHIRQLSGKITLDGKLEEKIWQRKADLEQFYFFGAAPEGFKPAGTKAYFYIDQRYIYVGVRCEEPFMDKIKVTGKKTDDAVWKDDGIELFFIPSPENSSYVQIVFNAAGVVFDLFQKEPGVTKSDISWNSNALCKTSKGKNFWSLEAAIPLETLPVEVPEGNWKFHMARNRAWKGENYSCVKGITSFHDVTQFFTLAGVKLPHIRLTVARYDLGEGKYGINRAAVLLKNWSREKITATLSVQGKKSTAVIAPRGSSTLHIDWVQPFNTSKVNTEVVVSEGKKVLRRLALRSELPEIIPDERQAVYYIERSKAILIPLTVNLTAESLRNARLFWEVKNLKGEKMVSGITTPRNGKALLRVFWSFIAPGNYKLKFNLVCDGKTIGKAQRDFRLVNSPFQGI